MSKASENRKTLYNFGKWLWHRLAYWGDKLLTLIYLLLFGLLIGSWRLSRWGYGKLTRGLKYVYSQISLFRRAKRYEDDYKKLGPKAKMRK